MCCDFQCLYFCFFVQYARADEMDRMKKEYTDCIMTLTDFATEAQRKISEPFDVSFMNVKLFTQDLEVREGSDVRFKKTK